MKFKKKLLFGGSFDPFHKGHLEMLNHVLQKVLVSDVFLIPAYQAPQKEPSLFSDQQRLNSLRALIQDNVIISSSNVRIECLDVECKQSAPAFTVDTLTYMQQHYSGSKFLMLIGSDQFFNLHTWKHPKSILQLTSLCVFQRDRLPIEQYQDYLDRHDLASDACGFMVFQNELMPYSSTEIRQRIKQGKPLGEHVPDCVQSALGLSK